MNCDWWNFLCVDTCANAIKIIIYLWLTKLCTLNRLPKLPFVWVRERATTNRQNVLEREKYLCGLRMSKRIILQITMSTLNTWCRNCFQFHAIFSVQKFNRSYLDKHFWFSGGRMDIGHLSPNRLFFRGLSVFFVDFVDHILKYKSKHFFLVSRIVSMLQCLICAQKLKFAFGWVRTLHPRQYNFLYYWIRGDSVRYNSIL